MQANPSVTHGNCAKFIDPCAHDWYCEGGIIQMSVKLHKSRVITT